ncbi:hypothetical protein [Acidovorax sp. SUPP2539]|uniref:hypothetical protein n=1 Tax=Acidovorax sp. SUPP2539 TaxID=2920878 RepID=UPI0023DE2754|nr:hypothetical protein [Acidovorax sp. SUPP2539]GKS91216.1 hypothetical protein AVTE2539_17645 [Acidovorax sp. SUPP2539]
MATITKDTLGTHKLPTTAPYGTASTLHYSLATAANGSVVGGSSTAAVASGDVVRVGILPAGMRLNDSLTAVSIGWTATVTGKLGFAYVDGVDVAAVPQDDDYFNSSLALATAGRYPANNVAVRPVVLPKDAYLIVTTGTAANAKASQTDFLVSVTHVGVA